MKVLHLIASLGNGGAENVLYNLVKNKTREDIEYKVIALKHVSNEDVLVNKFKSAGIDFEILSVKKNLCKALCDLKRNIKACDILSCWMYISSFVGLLLNKHIKKPIILNIRHSNLDKDKNSKITLLTNKYCMKNSDRVDAILYNGDTAREVHENYGYDKNKSYVINNGCDTELFSQNSNDREGLVKELGIDGNKKIVLSVGRYHVIKDFPNFLNAISKNLDKNIVGVICGNGIDINNQALVDKIHEYNLEIGKDIFLLGERTDVNRLMASSDVYVLHSYSEAFSNTLIQAMSSEIPVISTNAGVSKEVMVNKLLVSDVGDYETLAMNLRVVLGFTKEQSLNEGKLNREKILKEFNLNNIIKKYENLYLEVKK